jgi:hypothetical protein
MLLWWRLLDLRLAVVFDLVGAAVVGCALSSFFGVMTAGVFESSTAGLGVVLGLA